MLLLLLSFIDIRVDYKKHYLSTFPNYTQIAPKSRRIYSFFTGRLLSYNINNIIVLEVNSTDSDSTNNNNHNNNNKDDKDRDKADRKDIHSEKDGIKESEFDNKEEDTKNKKLDINGEKAVDPRFKRLLWYLIGSTRGGINRAKIMGFLNENPSNANQLSIQLKLDYKTVIHHLNVLKKNSLVITDNEDSYGATYFISPLMEKNYPAFKEIMDRIGKK